MKLITLLNGIKNLIYKYLDYRRKIMRKRLGKVNRKMHKIGKRLDKWFPLK